MKSRTFGTSNKPLSKLTDRELEEEVMRRRRARARGRDLAIDDPNGDPESPQSKQISQYYANLELSPGASMDDVRKAYRELMRRYHPDKHANDPARHKAATELAQSLTDAYRALSEHLGRTSTPKR